MQITSSMWPRVVIFGRLPAAQTSRCAWNNPIISGPRARYDRMQIDSSLSLSEMSDLAGGECGTWPVLIGGRGDWTNDMMVV